MLSFAWKYKKKIIDTGLDASKKVAHKASEPLGNKIKKQEPVEEIIISLEKRQETIKKIKKSIKKWNTIKYLNY